MRILLVEDDPQLGDGLSIGLRQAGFAVDWLKDGYIADQALQTESFDLVVLDLGLPRLSGMEVLSRARRRGQDLPILILTARDATGDKVAGLDTGADDFLVKPIDLDELTARIRALTRRSAGRAAPMLIHGELALDRLRAWRKLPGLDELEGRITSILLTPYPPGIPLLIPGERFNKTIVRYLKFARDFNEQFPGFETDIHGLVKAMVGGKAVYYVDCVR